MERPRSRRERVAATLAIALALAFCGWLAFGRAGIAASLLVSFPVAAWRHDNQVGACFPLALILVIVILILVVLIAMLGMLWAAHQ
jgi:hypothetical protein